MNFVKSLPWMAYETHGLKLSISRVYKPLNGTDRHSFNDKKFVCNWSMPLIIRSTLIIYTMSLNFTYTILLLILWQMKIGPIILALRDNLVRTFLVCMLLKWVKKLCPSFHSMGSFLKTTSPSLRSLWTGTTRTWSPHQLIHETATCTGICQSSDATLANLCTTTLTSSRKQGWTSSR